MESLGRRLEYIDALRGFALLGLFSVHMQEHFNMYETCPPSQTPWVNFLDKYVGISVFILFSGKAYAIFAFLFGFSFYRQTKRYTQDGIPYNARFVWRLSILFVFGLLHGLWYAGDILSFFGITGISLLALNKLPTKYLILAGTLLLLQVPSWYQLLLIINGNQYEQELIFRMKDLFAESLPVYKEGSFGDVIHFNWHKGRPANWLHIIIFGRFYQTIGLMAFAIVLGRFQFLENIFQYKSQLRWALLISVALFIICYLLSFTIPTFIKNELGGEIIRSIFSGYANVCFMVLLSAGFIQFYQFKMLQKMLRFLKYAGQMSLTNYILQSVVGVFLFYGFGLALYKVSGQLVSFLAGLAIFTVQLLASKWWLNRFYHGPVEWLWRVATMLSIVKVPFRKPWK